MLDTATTWTVRALYDALDARLPTTLSCPWDHDGLAVCPDPDASVRGVVVALDLTDDVIDLCEANRCNVILTHHPSLFHGLAAVDGTDMASRRVIRLIRTGIAAMAFHTRFDAAEGGVNDILAAVLGLSDVTPFGDADNPAGQPIGRMGILPAPLSPDELANRIVTALAVPATYGDEGIAEHLTPSCPGVRYAASGKPITRVAVLGGGGADEVGAAMAAGADAYVTGELKYHQFCDAPYTSLAIYAAGHFHTEFPACRRLAELVCGMCPGVPVHLVGETNERMCVATRPFVK